MSPKTYQRLEIITNVVIISVAILFGYVLIQKAFFSKPFPQPKGIEKGDKVSSLNIDWQSNQRTLVLVLQKGCKFCTESIPFYKSLLKKTSETNVKIVAVFPTPQEESSQYLKENAIEIQEIYQSSLNQLNIKGTPTMLLVNEEGVVSNVWIGKLGLDKEKEVIDSLYVKQK